MLWFRLRQVRAALLALLLTACQADGPVNAPDCVAALDQILCERENDGHTTRDHHQAVPQLRTAGAAEID